MLLGMLPVEDAPSPADIRAGHRRVCTPESFRAMFGAAGLKVQHSGGYWLKPLSNAQTDEWFTDEMIHAFDIADVNKSASAFNPEKLSWLNQQHLMRAEPRRVAVTLGEQLRAGGIDPGAMDLEPIVIAQRERTKTIREMASASQFFFAAPVEYETAAARKFLTPAALPLLAEVRGALQVLAGWSSEQIQAALSSLAATHAVGLGKVAQPLRVAVSGGSVSPPIDQTLSILGRTEVLKRIAAAEAFISRT